MINDILISVIVPVYNVKDYLKRCVNSILNQTYTKLEIILVDDGSTDGSSSICDEYKKKDNRIVVIHKPNGGLSSARNAAIQIARGDYFSFVDSDDYIEPNMLETMLNLCLENKVLMCCCGRFDEYEESGESKVGLCPQNSEVLSSEKIVRMLFAWEGMDSAAWDKLFHKNLWKTIRFPEGMVCEDMRVIYKACLISGQVVTCNRPFYHYCHHANSISTASFSSNRLDLLQQTYDIYCYIREHYPSLLDAATLLRVEETAYIAKEIGKLAKKDFLKFKADYKECVYFIRLFKKQWKKCRNISRHEKVLMHLHMAGLFRMCYGVYTIVKGKELE